MARILREKKRPRAGAEEDVIRILRIVAQAANIAAIRAQNRPLTGPAGNGDRQSITTK